MRGVNAHAPMVDWEVGGRWNGIGWNDAVDVEDAALVAVPENKASKSKSKRKGNGKGIGR